MDTLIVRLQAELTQDVDWLTISPKRVLSFHSGALEEVGRLSSGYKLIVLVPGQDVLMTTVMVPGKGRVARQATPYALEDQLTEDVDTLHFVVGRKSCNNERNVLIVSKARMQEWLTLLRDAGLQPSVMIPDYLALPSSADTISVFTDEKVSIVRMGQAFGFTSDTTHFEEFIPAEFNPETTERVTLGEKDLEGRIDFLQGKDEKTKNRGLFMALTAQYVIRQKNFDLNLLQATYQQSSEVKSFFKYWSLPFFLVSLLLLLQSGTTLYLNSSLKQQVENIEKSIGEIFKQTWPAAKSVNPRIQMDQKLKGLLKKQEDDESFFVYLKVMNSLFSEFPSAKVERLSYKDFSFTIDLKMTDKKLASSFKRKVHDQPDFFISSEQYLPDGSTLLTFSTVKK